MNLTEVKKSLEQQFNYQLPQGSQRHIVFWYDDGGEFTDAIDTLTLDNVKIIKVDNNNMFAVKLYIEETDRESNLLVYSPLPRPDSRDNWLTDTIKYSQTFSTDIVSLILLNYKIDNALRSVVASHKIFFNEKERCRRFEKYELSQYTEQKFVIGILSALCKLPAPNLDNTVRTLLIEMVNGKSDIYESISKFGNVDALWDLINKAYGYKFPEQSLEKLAILLLCSHLSHSINGNMPKDWQIYVSDNPNCFVFVDNFMRDSKDWNDYNLLAAFVADKLALSNHAVKWTIDEIMECDTFEDFDRSIIDRVNENISQNAGEYGHYRKIINSRKNRRYYKHFEKEYDVLYFACSYFEMAIKYKDLQGAGTLPLFENYSNDFYKLDSGYRHFIAAYDKHDENDVYGKLFEMVENNYTNWFLDELSMKWSACWDDEEQWQLPGVTPQQGFYEKYVRRFVSDNERIIVIISDGLRYESAVELNAIINREQKGESDLDVMLGVIPSTTSLGMAALLPHKQLDITDKAEIEIQGMSTEGTENRGKILKLVKNEAVAIQYEDVMRLINDRQLSSVLTGMKLIYIYHNTIDARGDNAPTENEVFEATDKAFNELSGLVRRLRNDISAINIIITADHGYIYRRTPLAEHDKTPKQELAGIKGSRRYLLTKENIEKRGTQNFSMDYLTKNNNSMYAVLPRITNCFKIQGTGSRYVHGGTSLQEIVIPVIRFKSDKNDKQSKGAKKVTLGLTNLSRKITSVITHLTFYQSEPVDEKNLPIRVTAYFEDEAGNRISNENVILADSTSKNPEERAYKEKFTLKNMAYDKSKNYYLVLKDEEELVNSELERIPFIIDLVFGGSINF